VQVKLATGVQDKQSQTPLVSELAASVTFTSSYLVSSYVKSNTKIAVTVFMN